MHVAIIGAGPSGLTAAKNCRQAGLPFTLYERSDNVGGNWVFNDTTGHSSVYENTHIISSKTLSSFEDYPMPASYPDYPGHRQVQAYFEAYARHFGVLPLVRFNQTVQHARREADGGWVLTVSGPDGDRTDRCTHLMVANGHHWNPRWPDIPGDFAGRYLHSHDFKRADDQWRDQRVLVIGAGNSAADVAVETSRVVRSVHMAVRSPQWFVPKYLFGLPADVIAARQRWVPPGLRQRGLTLLLRTLQGSYAKIGLPENTRPVLSQHPTLNSDLLDLFRHGRVVARPGVTRFDGHTVHFGDGTQDTYDIVVAATGFKITFPFFEPGFLDLEEATSVPLYRKMMHPDVPTVYFIGLFQPLGCIWPLADHQAKLACADITGRYRRPADLRARIAHEIAHPHYAMDQAPRHSTEVDYHRFRDELLAELATAERA
ncbi:flavin-containing monooxygenase [Gemmatimonas sp.]|jgi:cation diffusion facilitator CzcD-associated flavoprotein CzcO|uniref:flavin-containing monooxygenase n=1 Tax=Gemmatimonas sp. TaxID=1962908 RepID=UPI0037C14CFD